MAVSIGQAAASALADWLRSALNPDIQVYDRWPEPEQSLKNSAGEVKTVTVAKVGRRQRLDVNTGSVPGFRTNLTPSTCSVEIQLGSYMQPIQIDVWTAYDVDRDDILAQLDLALNAGMGQTLGIPDDPVRDGILVALRQADGFTGNIDCWFDEPEIHDAPDANQRVEYRATYFGEARGAFTLTPIVPRLLRPQLQLQASELPPGTDTTTPYDTTTLQTNPNPPPPIKVTHGQTGP